MITTCENCFIEFKTLPSWYQRSKHHYCSKTCSLQASLDSRRQQLKVAGQKTRFKLGQKPSINRRMPKGEQHHAWKGNEVGYRGLHYWVRRVRGVPPSCQMCGNKVSQWANIDGLYQRDPDNFIALCSPCHKNYDLALRATNEGAQDSI